VVLGGKRVYATKVYPPKINTERDFGQLYTSIVNVSGADQEIDKRKRRYQWQSLPQSTKTTVELWSTNNKVYPAMP